MFVCILDFPTYFQQIKIMRKKPRLFKRKGDNRWSFYFYDERNQRKHRQTELTAKSRAEEYAEAFCRDYFKEKEHREVLLEEFTNDFFIWDRCSWIKGQHAKGRPFSRAVADQRRSHLTKYILRHFGHRYLSSLNKKEIENWLIELPLANQTKNHILYTFRIVFREAVDAGLIDASPIEHSEPMGKDSKVTDVFTLAELKQLFPFERDTLITIWKDRKHAAAFMILATTGSDPGSFLRYSGLI
jgi:hypothetical protein